MGGRCFARRKFAISGRFCPASQWLGARWSLLECFATCHSRVLPQTGPTTQMWRIFNLNGRLNLAATSSLALHPRFVSTWLDRDLSKSDRVLRAALWCLNTLEEKIERCLLQIESGIVRKKEAGSFSRAVPGCFCRKKLTRVCGAVVALFTRHPRPHYWHIKLTDMPIILFHTDHPHRPTSFFDVNESIITHFGNSCSFGCFLSIKDDSSGLKFENNWTNRIIAVMINIIIIIILMILSVPHPHHGYLVWSGLVVSDEQRGVDWRADIAQSVRFHEEKHPVQRQEDEDDDDFNYIIIIIAIIVIWNIAKIANAVQVSLCLCLCLCLNLNRCLCSHCSQSLTVSV